MRLGNGTPQSKRCSDVDPSWWVSCLDNGAEAVLEQPWEGLGQCVTSSETLIWVPTCHCPPVWVCGDGPLMAWWLLWWSWEKPGQGIIWAPPPASVLLCGGIDKLLPHKLTLIIGCHIMLPSLLLSKVRDCTCDFYLLFQFNFNCCCTSIFYGSIPEQVVSQPVRDWPGFSLCFLMLFLL